MSTTMRRRVTTLAAAVSVALVLGACSGSDSPTSASSAEHNDADTEFAQMMIVHHEGAIEMADLAVSKAATEDVRALGERIAAAQGPEIETMSGWLEAWGEEQPDEAGHGGMDHGGMDMGGMDQEAAMDELEGLSGVEFDEQFLTLMTAHHEGAVEMSETEISEGANPDAIALAESIIDAQKAEIAEMQELLADL